MTEFRQPPIALRAADTANPALGNAAVAYCCNVWREVFEAELAKDEGELSAHSAAGVAYRNAMPPLSGYKSICDFIACAAHGLLIGAIEVKHSSKLLYAAQVALSTIRRQPGTREPVGE